jgi:hypothetical protein
MGALALVHNYVRLRIKDRILDTLPPIL